MLGMFVILRDAVNRRAVQRMKLHRRTLRDMLNPFEMPETEFIRIYRLTQDAANYLITELRPTLMMGVRVRSDAIPIEFKVLAAINFMASGSYQRRTGKDLTANMSQTMISHSLEIVVDAINRVMSHQWIVFPQTAAARQRVKQDFYNQAGFPGIIGAIDGTHVQIIGPVEDEHAYVNRKGVHTLNVMIVCDANLEILAINPRYPGSSHDAFVWANSALRRFMEEEYIRSNQNDGWLLGDSGYPLEPWLMVPILNAADGTPEAAFTKAHCQTRSSIERCIGRLKGRFRCLLKHRVLHYSPTKAAKIVTASAVLHNICQRRNDPMPDEDSDSECSSDSDTDTSSDDDHDDDPGRGHGRNNLTTAVLRQRGTDIRDRIINNHFR